ncbi:MAG TPA: hypothetical protein VGG45_16415 [Terracidiphilus sp.]|jgi:hypothetical protein
MAHAHLWNNLPPDERSRLYPWILEAHILHLTQTRFMIVAAHEALLRSLDSQIANIRSDLQKVTHT